MAKNLKRKKLILLDMDGVLNEYKGDYNEGFIDKPKQGTKEFLEKLSKNFEIKIFTTRNKILTAKWLIENSFDKYVSDITNVKEKASYLIVDDRCIKFCGNYENMLSDINNFETYWYS